MFPPAADGCKPMLDGVLQRRNEFFDIWRYRTAALSARPERNRWCRDERFAELDGVEVVVQIWPLAAVPRVAG